VDAVAPHIEQLDFIGRLALGDSRLEFGFVMAPPACGSFPWQGFIISSKGEIGRRH
jgi:hypothetical protein